jgi:cytochrome P450
MSYAGNEIAIDGRSWYADPQSRLAELDRTGPVHRVTLPDGMRTWLVTGYDECKTALSDPRLRKHPTVAAPELRKHLLWSSDEFALNRHMLVTDPPDHTRLRRMVSKAFTTRRIQMLRPDIQRITDELADSMAGGTSADLIRDFALPLPVAVICRLLGVPDTERDAFRHYADIITGVGASDSGAVMDAGVWFDTYLTDMVAQRRAAGGDDLISALLAVQEQDDQLTDVEIRSTAFLLLVAGFESTVNLIGNGVLALLSSPEVLAKLVENLDQVPAFVEEAVRFDGPGPILPYRFAAEDMTVGDVRISKGDNVMVAVAAANRDPDRFPDPTTLDPDRDNSRHIAFGHGVHFCLGAPLARLEGQVAFDTLLRRFDNLALAVPRDELTWRPSVGIRGLERLPVTFTPR